MLTRERFFKSAWPPLIGDAFAIVAAYYVMLFVRFHSEAGHALFTWINVAFGLRETAEVGAAVKGFYLLQAPRILCLLAATLLFLYGLLDLYAVRRFIRRRFVARHVAMANLIALGLFYAYFYLTRNEFHPRSVFATLLALNVPITLGLRKLMGALLRDSGLDRCRVLMLGRGPEADFLERYLETHRPQGLEMAERLESTEAGLTAAGLDRLKTLAGERRVDMLIVADRRLPIARIMQLLELSEDLRLEAKVLSDRLNVLVNEAGIPADFFMELPLVHFAAPDRSDRQRRIRRVLSRAVGLVLLAVAAPLLGVLALLIRMSSPGPVFFIQERIGIDRRPFRMYKFRTMRERAEELQAQMEEFNDSGEGLFKMRRDPRVTWMGRFLRRFSLDELPQLINVARGEMTLVGPRPLPRRDFENYYEEWHYTRHGGLPGLTCLWQVSGRSDVSFHNMCILDDYYLRNQGLLLDLKILARTVNVVLFAKGAY
jgi:exopolysaccharide biosynthesis polyprenyl glycosylphosphotransferase